MKTEAYVKHGTLVTGHIYVRHAKDALLEIGLPNTGHLPKTACGPNRPFTRFQ